MFCSVFIDKFALWEVAMVTVMRYFCRLPLGEKSYSKFQIIFSTSVLLLRYVCSYNKTNGLFQYQIRTADKRQKQNFVARLFTSYGKLLFNCFQSAEKKKKRKRGQL